MNDQTKARPPAGKTYREVVLDKLPETDYPSQMMHHIFHDILGVDEGRIVDVGCGRGDHVKVLRRLGFDAVGIDREPGEYVEAVCNIAEGRFPLDDNSVDVVFSKSVIEHLYIFQLDNYFGEVQRVLKPGGQIFLMTPDWITSWDDFYDGFTHVQPYTEKSLRDCLNYYGFEEVRSEILIQLPSVWRSSAMKFLADVTRIAFPGVRPKSWHKWIRWSKERQALGIGRKPVQPN